MSNFHKFCFRLWRAAKIRDKISIERELSRNFKLIDGLSNASSKDVTLFLTGIQQVPTQKKEFWEKVEKKLLENPNFREKALIVNIASLFSKQNVGSQEFWKQVSTINQTDIEKLNQKETTHLILGIAKSGVSKSAANLKVFDSISTKILHMKDEIASEHLGKLAWTYAKIRYKDIYLWKVLAEICLSMNEEIDKQEFVDLYWSFGRVYEFYKNQELLNILNKKLDVYINSLSENQLLMIAYALVCFGIKKPNIWQIILNKVKGAVKSAKMDYLIVMFYCLAKTELLKGKENQEYLEYFLKRFVSHLEKNSKGISTRDLANTSWIIAKDCNNQNENTVKFWSELEKEVLARKEEKINLNEASVFVHSFKKVGIRTPELWTKLAKIIKDNIEDLELQQLTIILNAYSYLNFEDQQFWLKMETQINRHCDSNRLSHYYLSKIIRSLSKVRERLSKEYKTSLENTFLNHIKSNPLKNIHDCLDYIIGFNTFNTRRDEIWSQLKQDFSELEKNPLNTLAKQEAENCLNQRTLHKISKPSQNKKTEKSIWIR